MSAKLDRVGRINFLGWIASSKPNSYMIGPLILYCSKQSRNLPTSKSPKPKVR